MESKDIIYIRESALQSLIADTITYGGILGLMYFNHTVLDGSWIIDVIFILFMFVVAIGKGNKKIKRFTSYKELQEYLRIQDEH